MNSIHLTPVQERSPGIGEITALLLPELGLRYSLRAQRLRHLAAEHAMGDYLRFVARIADVQQQLLDSAPLPAALKASLAARLEHPGAPLAGNADLSEPYWQELLRHLCEALYIDSSPTIRATLDAVTALDAAALHAKAQALLAGRFAEVDSGQALFIWAALALYFTQLAAHLPASAKACVGEHRQHCPVCASTPVASLIMSGAQAGLRYLHCGLCESRWHMVRVKCSNCEATGNLDYWSLEQHNAAAKAESCGDCHSYLKVFYPEHDSALELVADDLASLALDGELERQGFARSGLNPFLFPG